MKKRKNISPKTSILILTTILIFSFTNKSHGFEEPKTPKEAEAKTAILKKIEMANKRWASGDPLGFIECAADNITWIDDLGAHFPISGKETLKTYLEGFKGKVPPHEHKLSDFDFRFYDDVAIITYRYTGTFDGVPADPWKVTVVYKNFGGDWLSVHENWSVVKKKE